MSKSVGIKLADGTFYPIVEEGFSSKKIIELTTVQENQTKVCLDIYRSETGTIGRAEYIATLEISNLSPQSDRNISLKLSIEINERNVLFAELFEPYSKKTDTLRYDLDNYKVSFLLSQFITDHSQKSNNSIPSDPFDFRDVLKESEKELKKRNRNNIFIIIFCVVTTLTSIGILVYVLFFYLPKITEKETHINIPTSFSQNHFWYTDFFTEHFCFHSILGENSYLTKETKKSEISSIPEGNESILEKDDVKKFDNDDNVLKLDQNKSTPLFLDNTTSSQSGSIADYKQEIDVGLSLYRSTHTKMVIENFYTNITKDYDIALAILQESDKNNIPLSLAFSLAYIESNYRVEALNQNNNSSIDRGLFQLNDNSFPTLTEEEFYNPYINAKYGLSHLRFCLDRAGNEVAALAMYNAGTNRVRNNGAPQMTLNYISKIQSYREELEMLFDSEIIKNYFSVNKANLAIFTK